MTNSADGSDRRTGPVIGADRRSDSGSGRMPLSVGGAGVSAAAERPADSRQTRAEAIKATLAAINADLEKYGEGSWQKWGESNKAFRDAISKFLDPAIKWPWPAKNDFAFQGTEIQMTLRDTLDDPADGKRPYDAVVSFNRRLKAEGVDLIFAPLPDKMAIYGDYLATNAPPLTPTCCQVKHLMRRLLEADVEVVDLYSAFLEHRAKHGDEAPLYYDRDSHWRNRAAQLAAEKIAERLKRYDFVQEALAGGNRYTTRDCFRPDKPDEIGVVLDAETGGVYNDDNASPVVVMGDSNAMMNMGSTGGHMPAHIGRHIGLPLTFVAPVFSDAAAKVMDRLGGKRVVIWANIARTLGGGAWTVLGPPPEDPGGKVPAGERNRQVPALANDNQ